MKRFYGQVTVAQAGDGFCVQLVGRAIKTVSGRPQIVPTRALAQAMAQEWDGQEAEIDPARFLFRDMADYAIDVVLPDPAAAIDSLLPYAATDTLCYRAEPDEAFAARKLDAWVLEVEFAILSGAPALAALFDALSPSGAERERAALRGGLVG